MTLHKEEIVEPLVKYLNMGYETGILNRFNIKFESRYFSSMYFIEINGGERKGEKYIVKFPKVKLSRGYDNVPERVKGDIDLARMEYESLCNLNKIWNFEHSEYLKPLFFDEKKGAIYLPHYPGKDLFNKELRNNILQKVVGAIDFKELQYIKQIGNDLGLYHKKSFKLADFDFDDYKTKILELAKNIYDLTGQKILTQVKYYLTNVEKQVATQTIFVDGIKGFELRNILISRNKKFILFDPGKIKREPAAADLARFIVSCRILFWGSPYFSFRINNSSLENNFLLGYNEQMNAEDGVVLNLYILKITLKEWIAKYKTTASKNMPDYLKKFFVTYYLNRGFKNLLKRQIVIG